MKFMRFFLPGLVAVFIAGCSSTPSKVNTGAIRATTFSFVAVKPNASRLAENRQAVHAVLQRAITNNLERKGVKPAASGGDITVAYMLIVGNNASTMAVNDYFGYGRDTTAITDKAQKAYDSQKTPDYFEAGTLVIDILDSRTNELLVRTYATRPVLREATDDVRAQRVQEAVDEALAGLNITR